LYRNDRSLHVLLRLYNIVEYICIFLSYVGLLFMFSVLLPHHNTRNQAVARIADRTASQVYLVCRTR